MGFVKRGHANTFLQIAPDEVWEYLTSTGVGDVNIPKRPRTVKYDPDIRRSGEWVATEFIRGEPSEITAPFTRPLDTVRNYLQELDCAVNARINWACRGDRNISWNYELALLLVRAEFEAGSVGQPAVAQPSEEDRVQTGGDLKALGWTYLYLLEGLAQTVTGDGDIYDIVFLPEECGDRCGRRIKLGCEGMAVRGQSPSYLYLDNVIETTDCGQTAWDPTTTDPFDGSRDGLCMITVETATGSRIIIGGEGLAGNFAAASYTDDWGVTWNNVTVGAVAGQGINWMCRDVKGRIWAAASDGYVYYSDNLGQTWAASHSADETTEDLLSITFPTEDYSAQFGIAVGTNNTVIVTGNRGTSWAEAVGPAVGVDLNTIDFNYMGYLFIGADDGTIHRSIDDGDEWVEILDMEQVGDSFARLRFDEDIRYVGYAVWNDEDGMGHLLRSEDGGVSWMLWETPDNIGLNSLFVCDPNMVYVCGNDGFIAKFDRAAS